MKTIQEFKDAFAQGKGRDYPNWDSMKADNLDADWVYADDIAIGFAIEVLQSVRENTKTIFTSYGAEVDFTAFDNAINELKK